MVSNKKSIAVDEKFFNNVFEAQRKRLQQQLGITNLSQPNFTKMIIGLKIRQPKIIQEENKKGRKKKYGFFTI